MKQITKEQAIAIHGSGIWKKWTPGQLVDFQFAQEKLAVDFGDFHEAVEEIVGRPVWKHEFLGDRLKKQIYKKRKRPTEKTIFELVKGII